jgi:hypothetical protein
MENFKENSRIKKLKYESVLIFTEIWQYLSIQDLIEVSLVNRYLRTKLVGRILAEINLTYYHLSQLPNYFNNRAIEKNESIDEDIKLNFKHYKIDPFVNELVNEMKGYSRYFKSFEFFDLARDGYFIVPLTLNFANLTTLKICECMLDLENFNEVLKRLDKLKMLELFNISLFKQPGEIAAIKEAILPSSLKALYLSNIYLYTTDFTKYPYKFLFDFTVEFEEEYYYLPLQRTPNLEEFELYETTYDEEYLSKFLELNPQLSKLRLPFSSFTYKTISTLSKSNRLKYLTIDFSYYYGGNFNIIDLPLLDSVNSLFVFSTRARDCNHINSVIRVLPNITKVKLITEEFDQVFISYMLNLCKQLKFFNLKVGKFKFNNLDLSIFSKVEGLKLCFTANNAIKYSLPESSMKLKSLYISSDKYYKESYDLLKETYKSDYDWKIKLIGRSISCRVVSSN